MYLFSELDKPRKKIIIKTYNSLIAIFMNGFNSRSKKKIGEEIIVITIDGKSDFLITNILLMSFIFLRDICLNSTMNSEATI